MECTLHLLIYMRTKTNVAALKNTVGIQELKLRTFQQETTERRLLFPSTMLLSLLPFFRQSHYAQLVWQCGNQISPFCIHLVSYSFIQPSPHYQFQRWNVKHYFTRSYVNTGKTCIKRSCLSNMFVTDYFCDVYIVDLNKLQH